MSIYPSGEAHYNAVFAFPNGLDTPESRERWRSVIETLAATSGGALISFDVEREERDRPVLNHKVLLNPEVQERLDTPVEELLSEDGIPATGVFKSAAKKIRDEGACTARDILLAGGGFLSDIRGVGRGAAHQRIATNLSTVCPEISFDYNWDAADAAQFCRSLSQVGACALGLSTRPRQTIADLMAIESSVLANTYRSGFVAEIEAYATMFTAALPQHP